MSSRPWADQRGFTLAELLVSAVVGAVVLLGMFSLYRATATSFNQTSSQAYLQRQGTLALQQIAQRAQQAATITVQSAPGCAPGSTTGRSLSVCVGHFCVGDLTADSLPVVGTYCYYAGNGANGATAGALCENFTPKGGAAKGCRDLLGSSNLFKAGSTGLVRQTNRKPGEPGITLVLQPDLRFPCPKNLTNPPGTSQAGGVAIADNTYCLALDRDARSTKGDVAFAITDGLDGMTFSASLMLRNKN